MSTSEFNDANESSALLSVNTNTSSPEDEEAPHLPSTTAPSWNDAKDRSTLVLVLCTICILCVDAGLFLQMAPLTRILESIVCESYYSKHPDLEGFIGAIPEEMCKIPAVQSSLALLKGWFALLDCIPGLLLAVPYGFVADKYGRKVVMLLSVSGVAIATGWNMLVCYYPSIFAVQLIWLGPAFNIIGGGGIVATSTIFTIIADVVPESQRSIIFFRVTGAVLAAQLIAIPVSSVMMEYNLWAPMFLGEGALVIGGLALVAMPETLKLQPDSKPLLSPDANREEEEVQEAHYAPKADALDRLAESTKWFTNEARSVFASPGVTILVLTFLVNSIGRSSIDLLLQYTSQRYHWTIAQASRLLSLSALAKIILFFVILPAISWALTKYSSTSAATKELQTSRVSVTLLAIGCLGIGFAATPALLILSIITNALGVGFSASIRSLATSLVEPDQVGRLYAAIATFDMIGGLVAGPTLSSVYSWGLGRGGGWVGAPYLLAGVMYCGIAICVWGFRVRRLE